MLKHKLVILLTILAIAGLGLSGCRRQDTSVTPTPAAADTPQKQLIPMLGTGSSPLSPLPTPGTGSSPVGP